MDIKNRLPRITVRCTFIFHGQKRTPSRLPGFWKFKENSFVQNCIPKSTLQTLLLRAKLRLISSFLWNNVKNIPTVRHFRTCGVEHLKLTLLEKVRSHTIEIRRARENFWITKLKPVINNLTI